MKELKGLTWELFYVGTSLNISIIRDVILNNVHPHIGCIRQCYIPSTGLKYLAFEKRTNCNTRFLFSKQPQNCSELAQSCSPSRLIFPGRSCYLFS